MVLHKFDDYILRLATSDDLELAAKWTGADPDHAGRVDPKFWLEQNAHAESWLLYDAQGPVFFFKAVKFEELRLQMREKIIEVHIQFSPAPAKQETHSFLEHNGRVARALIDGTAWFEKNIHGYSEIRFDSKSPALVRFCQKHLRFTKQGQRLYKRLAA